MHAFGNAETERVTITELGREPWSMTVEDAAKLQRQLGVAIHEAVGQMELVPRTHGDLTDQEPPYQAKVWREPGTGDDHYLVYNRAGCAVGGPFASFEAAERAAQRMTANLEVAR